MSVIAPVENIGLDAKIYLIQKYLDGFFSELWAGDVVIYGRLHETIRNDKKTLEAYTIGKDYKEVFVNDKESCSVGFIEISRAIDRRTLTSKLSAVFTGNIKKLLAVDSRNDERIFLQIYHGLRKSMLINNISNPKRGIDDVFSGFKTDSVKYRDMQPWFCFSFEIEVQYNENIC
jgi:hypothetical protein